MLLDLSRCFCRDATVSILIEICLLCFVLNELQPMPVTNSVCAMSDNGLDLDKMNPLGELNFFFGNASVNQFLSTPVTIIISFVFIQSSTTNS